MRVLGIDPGSVVAGFGIVDIEKGEISCVDYGCVALKKNMDFTIRLKTIFDEISNIIQQYGPEQAAFEDIFYGRNVKTTIQLSHARAAAVLSAANSGLNVSYYSSREVKQAVTGYGSASKEQVQKMVQSILQITGPISPLDASDALAIAMCHAFRYKTGNGPI